MSNETGRGDNTTPTESHSDSYNGWANRETWAVALHINNDQGWQESVREAVRNAVDGATQDPSPWLVDHTGTVPTATLARVAGDAVRENVKETLDNLLYDGIVGRKRFAAAREAASFYRGIVSDIGSLWRVDWRELGASFLADLEDDDA